MVGVAYNLNPRNKDTMRAQFMKETASVCIAGFQKIEGR